MSDLRLTVSWLEKKARTLIDTALEADDPIYDEQLAYGRGMMDVVESIKPFVASTEGMDGDGI